jgi:predicted TIM-barrel fold metal-dependent hydrolase
LTAPPTQGGWDCHTHVFGPYDRYPLAEERSYTPPPATEADYAAHLARLGLTRGVLVHPSAYGDDHSLLLATLAAHPSWRGVAVKREGTVAELTALRAKGVRATRYSHRSINFAGSPLVADLQAMAPALADAGLHAELWTDHAALPGIADMLCELPVPVVIDHMGGFDHRTGVDAPGFRTLLSLVETGRVWVKLSAYRNVLDTDLEAARPFHKLLLEANPAHMVWGSDWPHLRIDPLPDALQLLDTFKQWTGDDALIRAVLVDNPTRLYG